MSKVEKVSRRKVLAGAAALLGSSSSVSIVSGQSEAQDGRDPTKVQGRLASEIGQRSRFEQPQRTVPGAGIVSAPLQDLELGGTSLRATRHDERDRRADCSASTEASFVGRRYSPRARFDISNRSKRD